MHLLFIHFQTPNFQLHGVPLDQRKDGKQRLISEHRPVQISLVISSGHTSQCFVSWLPLSCDAMIEKGALEVSLHNYIT